MSLICSWINCKFSGFYSWKFSLSNLLYHGPIKTDWGVEFGSIINKCIWNSYESDDTSEVKRIKFTRDDAEVSAQLSKQHGLLKSTVSFSKCRVIKTYEYAGLRFPEYCDGGRLIIPR